MRKRIITGACFFVGIVALLLLAQSWWYAIICSLVGAWAIYEYLRAYGVHRQLFFAIPSYALAITCPLLAYLPQSFSEGAQLFFTALVAYVVLQVVLSVAFYAKADTQIFSTVSFGTIYVTTALSALVILSFAHPDFTAVMVLPVIIASLVTDTCAFFVGICFGKHKLAPELSPKKTIEGSIGGVICCVIVFYIYAWVVCYTSDLHTHWGMIGVFGVVSSIVAQIGDLIMSKIKRENGIKDFGTVFPGHGGMLDRFDSILPTAIVCLFFALLPDAASLFY